MEKIYKVKNLKETKKLAQKFASSLNGGEVVLLIGDLGSGKTTFTKEVFKNLGFKGVIASPTFTIMQQYVVKKFNLFHFDFYRIEDVSEVENFGVEEYIYNRDINAISFMEWPEKIMELIKGDFLVVQITKTGNDEREFSIEYRKF